MRVKTGIAGLDELVEGGFVKNDVYLLTGPPGSGRTTFGIQFLIQGAQQNEKGLFIALTETPTNVIKHMSRFKFNLVKYVKEKKIFFMDYSSELFDKPNKKLRAEESDIFDLSGEQTTSKDLFEKIGPVISKTGTERLVIDSTLALSFLTKSRETEVKQIAKYINALKQLEVTTILLSELIDPNLDRFEHYLCSGIINMHHFPKNNETEMRRAIQLLKFRGTKHDSMLHPISFTESGLKVGGSIEVTPEPLGEPE